MSGPSEKDVIRLDLNESSMNAAVDGSSPATPATPLIRAPSEKLLPRPNLADVNENYEKFAERIKAWLHSTSSVSKEMHENEINPFSQGSMGGIGRGHHDSTRAAIYHDADSESIGTDALESQRYEDAISKGYFISAQHGPQTVMTTTPGMVLPSESSRDSRNSGKRSSKSSSNNASPLKTIPGTGIMKTHLDLSPQNSFNIHDDLAKEMADEDDEDGANIDVNGYQYHPIQVHPSMDQRDRKGIPSIHQSNLNDDSSEISDDGGHPLLGMILTVLSAFCYAGLNLSVKALMLETPWQEIMLIRMFVTWIATLLWIWCQFGTSINYFGPPEQRLLLALRAFFLWGAMFCCFWSFEFLPVGDAVTLAMSFPVWVSLFAHFVFKHDASQRLDLFGWIFVLSGLAGVIFVSQPAFIFGDFAADNRYKNRDAGLVIGILSAMCAGAQYIIVNYTKKNCHWLQIEQMTAFLSTFILMPLGYIGFAIYEYIFVNGQFTMEWEQLSWWRWLEEIGLGLLGFVALALLTRGSQLDAPSRTAICLYLQIPVTYIGQCLISHSVPNYLVFVGIAFVIISVLVPAVRKMKRSEASEGSDEMAGGGEPADKIDLNGKVSSEKRGKIASEMGKRERAIGDERVPLLRSNKVVSYQMNHYAAFSDTFSVQSSDGEL